MKTRTKIKLLKLKVNQASKQSDAFQTARFIRKNQIKSSQWWSSDAGSKVCFPAITKDFTDD